MKSFLCESGSKFLLPYIVCVCVRVRAILLHSEPQRQMLYLLYCKKLVV